MNAKVTKVGRNTVYNLALRNSTLYTTPLSAIVPFLPGKMDCEKFTICAMIIQDEISCAEESCGAYRSDWDKLTVSLHQGHWTDESSRCRLGGTSPRRSKSFPCLGGWAVPTIPTETLLCLFPDALFGIASQISQVCLLDLRNLSYMMQCCQGAAPSSIVQGTPGGYDYD